MFIMKQSSKMIKGEIVSFWKHYKTEVYCDKKLSMIHHK